MINKGAILVVDDTHANLKLLTDILAAEGYQVRPADGGEIALASVAAAPPDLVLLDIRMPGMDGFEVFRRLRMREESRDIPVMFISAVTEVEQRVEGLKLGAVDFIS
jgi:DNA-binding response OmpR family regulator